MQVDVQWTRANLREVLPDLPSPQSLSMISRVLNRGMSRYYGHLLAPESTLGPIARVFCGRLYFNLSQFLHIGSCFRTPPAAILRSMGHGEDIRPEDELVPRSRPRNLWTRLPDIGRLILMQISAGWLRRRHLRRSARQLALFRRVDPRTRTDLEILSTLKNRERHAVDELQVVLVFGGVGVYEVQLRGICKRVGRDYKRLLDTHLAAGEKSVSTQQAFDLLSLAEIARTESRACEYMRDQSLSINGWRTRLQGTEFLKRFDEFLDKYGHRGIYESDIAVPRHREDPAPLLFAIRQHVLSPESPRPSEVKQRQEQEARDAWAEFVAELGWWQRLTAVLPARILLRTIKRRYMWREECRSELVRIVSEIRRWSLAVADRFVERHWIEQRDDYFFLRVNEIDRAVRNQSYGPELGKIVRRRRAHMENWKQIEMPLLMRESQLVSILEQPFARGSDAGTSELHGLGVSPGTAEGEVIVMHSPHEFSRMKRGAVLVAPATDPSWTALFTLASGVIVEIGGMLSHASTVAREFGLPAIANVKNATQLLKDGDRVSLDARQGVVRRISTNRGTL
jgi:phosphohistidine swiveling domain-containing protein